MTEPIKPVHRTFHCCSCEQHALEVTVWLFNGEEDSRLVDVNYWKLAHTLSPWRKWWQRIRDAYRILRYGTLWIDSVSLRPSDARTLAKELLVAAGKAK